MSRFEPKRDYEGVLPGIDEHYWHPIGVKGYWSVIKPYGESLVNAALNPSFEFFTDHWIALGGATWLRDRDAAIHGDIGALVTTTGGNQGIGYQMYSQFSTGTHYSACVSVDGPAGAVVTFKFEYANPSVPTPAATQVRLPGYPIRICAQLPPVSLNPSSATLPIGIRFDRAGTYNVDGLMLTTTTTPIETYFDGDSPHAGWQGTPNNSASTIDGFSRQVGERFNLNENGFNFTAGNGFGLTPRQLITSPFARLNGAHLQRVKELPRVIMLTGTFEGAPEDMHEARSELIESLRWKFKNQCTEELLLCYSLVDECGCQISPEVQIPCELQSGLEGAWSTLDRERVTLVFTTSGEQSFVDSFDTSGELTLNGTVLVTNEGTDDVWPDVYIFPGATGMNIDHITNVTTGHSVVFGTNAAGGNPTALPLSFGQYAILRTDPRKRISLDLVSYPGGIATVTRIMHYLDHVERELSPGATIISRVGEFRLIPGENQFNTTVSLLSSGSRAFLRWRNRYESVDHLRPGLCPEIV